MPDKATDDFNDTVLRDLVALKHQKLMGQPLTVKLTVEQIALIKWALETFESYPVLRSLAEIAMEYRPKQTLDDIQKVLRSGFNEKQNSKKSVDKLCSQLDAAIEAASS